MIVTGLVERLLNIDVKLEIDGQYGSVSEDDFPKSFVEACNNMYKVEGLNKLISTWVDAMSNLAIAESIDWFTPSNLNDRVFLSNYIELLENKKMVLQSNIELSRTMLGARLYKKEVVDQYYPILDRLEEVLLPLKDHLKSL